eukprot:GEMP01034664.1.p1 GENE.GEMP01034664.1~~GEMP01034664.1.p1  ORF type:complete len:281 (+),score=54.49 GEMP01034664.1:250-1092(+)
MNTRVSELPTLFTTLTGADEEPVTMRADGFWSVHSEPLAASSSSNNPFRSWGGSDSRIDWIFPSLVGTTSDGANKTFTTTSKTMIYQYVAVRSSTCYALNLRDTENQWLSDLSDHYAVFAKICDDTTSCAWTDAPVVLPDPTCPSTPPTDAEVADFTDCSPATSARFCAGRVCDAQTSRCVACANNGVNDTCSNQSSTKICDVGTGFCVVCLSSDDCADSVCDDGTKRCKGCKINGSTNTCETRTRKQLCDDNTGTCVETISKSFHQTLWAAAFVLLFMY